MTLMLAPMISHDQKSHFAPHFDYLHLKNTMVSLTLPSTSCDTRASDVTGIANCITWWKSHTAHHFDHLNLRNVMVPFTMLSVSHQCQCHQLLLMQWYHMTIKVMLHLISVVLTWGKWWCHWWCCWNHVTLMPVPMASNDQSHAAPHFNCLDLRNAMVPLKMLSIAYDADTNALTSQNTNTNAIMWCQWYHMTSHVASPFSCLNLTNTMVPPMMLLASCDTNVCANGIKWPKSHVSSHFDCHDPINAVVPF